MGACMSKIKKKEKSQPSYQPVARPRQQVLLHCPPWNTCDHCKSQRPGIQREAIVHSIRHSQDLGAYLDQGRLTMQNLNPYTLNNSGANYPVQYPILPVYNSPQVQVPMAHSQYSIPQYQSQPHPQYHYMNTGYHQRSHGQLASSSSSHTITYLVPASSDLSPETQSYYNNLWERICATGGNPELILQIAGEAFSVFAHKMMRLDQMFRDLQRLYMDINNPEAASARYSNDQQFLERERRFEAEKQFFEQEKRMIEQENTTLKQVNELIQNALKEKERTIRIMEQNEGGGRKWEQEARQQWEREQAGHARQPGYVSTSAAVENYNYNSPLHTNSILAAPNVYPPTPPQGSNGYQAGHSRAPECTNVLSPLSDQFFMSGFPRSESSFTSHYSIIERPLVQTRQSTDVDTPIRLSSPAESIRSPGTRSVPTSPNSVHPYYSEYTCYPQASANDSYPSPGSRC